MNAKTQLDQCPTCGSLVRVEGSGEGAQHYVPYKSQETQAIQAQADRLLELGGEKVVHLQAAVSEYLRRQRVLAEREEARRIDDDPIGVIVRVD